MLGRCVSCNGRRKLFKTGGLLAKVDDGADIGTALMQVIALRAPCMLAQPQLQDCISGTNMTLCSLTLYQEMCMCMSPCGVCLCSEHQGDGIHAGAGRVYICSFPNACWACLIFVQGTQGTGNLEATHHKGTGTGATQLGVLLPAKTRLAAAVAAARCCHHGVPGPLPATTRASRGN